MRMQLDDDDQTPIAAQALDVTKPLQVGNSQSGSLGSLSSTGASGQRDQTNAYLSTTAGQNEMRSSIASGRAEIAANRQGLNPDQLAQANQSLDDSERRLQGYTSQSSQSGAPRQDGNSQIEDDDHPIAHTFGKDSITTKPIKEPIVNSTQGSSSTSTFNPGGMIGATNSATGGLTTTTSSNGVTQAVPAAGVTPSTGTAATYNSTSANAAGNVTPGTVTAGKATGTQTSVNRATDTVSGQIEGIIDHNSPLMQRAIQLANERSNSRGMINSSIGTNAAQSALYDAATPIATADAATYNQTRLANQTATNQASIVNAQLSTDVSKANVANALQAGIVNQDQANRITMFNAQNANAAAQFNAASAQDMNKFNIDNLLRAGIINQEQANRMSMFNVGEVNAQGRLETDVAGRVTTANIGASAQIGAAQIGAASAANVAGINTASNQAIARLDADTRRDITNIEAQYRNELQGSASASNLYSGTMNNITSIMSNTNLTDDAKQTAITNLTGGLNNGLALISQMNRLNLGTILTFGAPAAGGTSSATGGSTGTNTGTGTNTAATGNTTFAGNTLKPPIGGFRSSGMIAGRDDGNS